MVFVPDFNINTQGKDVPDAIEMARAAIGLMGIDTVSYTHLAVYKRQEHIRKSWDKTIPPPEYFRELERVS